MELSFAIFGAYSIPYKLVSEQLYNIKSVLSLAQQLQRRWKSLRDSYQRENLLRKKEKASGSAKSNRTQYVYFEQLHFLAPSITNKNTTTNFDGNCTQNIIEESQATYQDENEEHIYVDEINQSTSTPPSKVFKRKKMKLNQLN
ncbi:hypothetical protein QTP88_004647 [Uroleucon formosanum]